MPNIDPEIQAFQQAEYGEDVRAALVSLARKLNAAVEDGIVSGQNLASLVQQANTAKSNLQTVVTNAQSIKNHVDNVNSQIDTKLTNASNVVPDVTALKTWKASVEAGNSAVVVSTD